MRSISIAGLILNLLFLCCNSLFLYINIKINVATCRLDDQVRNRTAELVVHEFINNSRNHISKHSFEVSEDHVHYEPEGMPLPYTITLSSSEYSDRWRYKVQFNGGKAYGAEVWRLDGNRWWLCYFTLIDPNATVEKTMTKTILRIFVNMAQEYMREHRLSTVDYRTLVDANCFAHYDYPFLEEIQVYADFSNFEINDVDVNVNIVTKQGDSVSFDFEALSK